MNRTNRARLWIPLAVLAAACVLVVLTGILDRQQVWVDMMEDSVRQLRPGRQSREAGDPYGILTEGPGLTLPPGEYRLKWIIDCDGENVIRLKSSNDVEFSPSQLQVLPGRANNEAFFSFERTVTDFTIETEFADGTFIEILDFRLYSPRYRDNTFTFVLLALLAGSIWVMVVRGTDFSKRAELLLVAAAVGIACIPVLKDNMALVYDTTFHAARFMNVAEGIRNGVFPVRMGAWSYNGYGALTSVFYPDLLLYPFAVLLVAGASLNYVMHLYIAVLSAAAGILMFRCAKTILRNEQMAVVAAVCYVLSIYRITNCFVRCALGEATAMSLFPLFLEGLWEVLFGDRRRWRVLVLGASGIFLCHMLSTLLALALALPLMILRLPALIREKRLGTLCLAGAAALALCAFQIVPMVTYLRQGIGPQAIMGIVENNSLSPAQLFLWGDGDMPVDPFDSTLSGQPLEIGMGLILGAVLAGYALLENWNDEQRRTRRTVLLLLFLGGMGAFATTTMFPWHRLTVLTGGRIGILQHAWRFLVFPALFLALSSGYGYSRMLKAPGQAALVSLIVCTVVALPTLSSQTRFNDVVRLGESTTPQLWYTEYTIPGTQVKETGSQKVEAGEGIEVTHLKRKGTDLSCEVEAEREGNLLFPLFAYDGYRVRLGETELPYTCGENNRMQVQVPQGGQGRLTIRYEGKAYWHIAEAVSLLAALALGSTAWKRRKT